MRKNKKECRRLRLPFHWKTIADLTLLEFVGCDHLSFFICPKGGFLRTGDDHDKKGPGGLLIRESEYVPLGGWIWNFRLGFLDT